jgi:hypothetical protein
MGWKMNADLGPGIIFTLLSLAGLAGSPVAAALLPSRFESDSNNTGADLVPCMRV